MPKLVVIGNGMAGIRTLEELLKSAPHQYEITVFGSEPHGNYNRIMLSSVLSGEKVLDDIFINDQAWYDQHNITLYSGASKTVTRIDRQQRKVYTQDGTVADYDRLLISTGSKPTIANVPGNQLAGIISFRDIADVSKMLAYSKTHRNAIVLGGGLLGLEAANGLALRGMSVTVIHNNAVLLNRQMDKAAGILLQKELETKGLRFKMACQVEQLLGDDQHHIKTVRLTDGTELECDLLVMAIGVKPNKALAEAAGLYCEQGIIVNDTLQTYDPRVYAVGECIQHRGQTFGLVAPVFEQAKVCANHLTGHGVAQYLTLPTATKLKVTGIQVFSIGDFVGDHTTETIQFTDTSLGIYKKLVLKANKLVGAVLYGDTQDGYWYQELLEKAQSITPIREQLIFGKAYV